MTEDKFKAYPKTEHFSVVDTIGVPHPYCITPKHVAYASDHCHGMLGKEAIIGAEKAGACCDICKKAQRAGKIPRILKYDEHEQALLIECKVDIKTHQKEAHAYLVSIKDQCEKDGYAGFAFKRA